VTQLYIYTFLIEPEDFKWGVTAGPKRDSDIVKRCGYIKTRQLIEVEGGRQIHESFNTYWLGAFMDHGLF